MPIVVLDAVVVLPMAASLFRLRGLFQMQRRPGRELELSEFLAPGYAFLQTGEKKWHPGQNGQYNKSEGSFFRKGRTVWRFPESK